MEKHQSQRRRTKHAGGRERQEPGITDVPEAVAHSNASGMEGQSRDLVERVKELNCLYGISRLRETRDLSLNEILQGIVALIPPAWQYPEITCARIKLKNRQFGTANFAETPWKQAETIKLNNKRFGTLVVCYLEPKPECDEGPFLKEERNLIHVIAERLARIIESDKTEKNVQSLYQREKKLRQRLQIEMEARVDFTRKMIHELKTPLTALMATSQLLLDETRDTKLAKPARYVWQGAESLNNRIEELHDVIRGEIGALELDLKSIDVGKLLRSLADETIALSRQHGMSIDIELDESLPKVKADPERVRQIVFNLINNAFKYAGEGERISIKATRKSGSVVIEVRDYGPGISTDRQRGLFEPGYHLSHHSRETGGLGIGLALCKILVEAHGGRMWLRSQVGRGSSFFFTLPIAKKS
jgi:signal transduction histidine kinase